MAQYTLKVISDFAAAHVLRAYPGQCSQMHGHNWKVEADVTASTLDDIGMGVDFKVIKAALRELTAALDHRYLNELEAFAHLNPTAENIARHLFNGLSDMLNNERIRVSAITVWETERACVRYSDQ